MTIILAPGQSSQKVGMLQAWLNIPELSSKVEHFSEITNLDLRYLGTLADTEEITQTSIAQPLIVTAGILAYRYALSQGLSFTSDTIIAGHSIGELTAAAIASVISDDDAIYLAAHRGALMDQACQEADTSMAAILGGDYEKVLQKIVEYDLTAANFNAQGQIVAAGTKANITQLIATPPEGTRIRELTVAGAFHSPYMASAQSKFAELVSTIEAQDPEFQLLTNKDGSICTNGSQFLGQLIHQLTSPVYWTSCLETMRNCAEDSLLIELAPAGTLIAIAKRELKNTTKVAFNSPEDIQAFTQEARIEA